VELGDRRKRAESQSLQVANRWTEPDWVVKWAGAGLVPMNAPHETVTKPLRFQLIRTLQGSRPAAAQLLRDGQTVPALYLLRTGRLMTMRPTAAGAVSSWRR
jgi:hypothetical protein